MNLAFGMPLGTKIRPQKPQKRSFDMCNLPAVYVYADNFPMNLFY